MPKFSWRAIDYSGAVSRCVGHKISRIHLQCELEQTDRYLLSVYQYPVSRIFTIKKKHIAQFFANLYSLIKSGITIDKALIHISKVTHNSLIKMVLNDLIACIQEGMSLHDACSEYKNIFDPIVLHLIKAGEESDALQDALYGINNYFSMRMQFTQQVKKALLMPAITFLFFILIASGIFTYIVPTFASLLTSAQKDIPWITRMMLNISHYASLYVVGIVSISLVTVHYAVKKVSLGKNINLKMKLFLSQLPLIGPFIKNYYLSYILSAWELLHKRGILVTHSLFVISQSLNPGLLKMRIQLLLRYIEGGHSVSAAMKKISWPFDDDLAAIIHVGEESGHFENTLQEVNQMYTKRLKESLLISAYVIQPICIFVLGILVLFLVFAIYIPVIELADSII